MSKLKILFLSYKQLTLNVDNKHDIVLFVNRTVYKMMIPQQYITSIVSLISSHHIY